jgi:microcompartment protein CcmK/EutM
MEQARVIGTVVATVIDPSLVGVRLLVVQPEDADGAPNGPPTVAADALQCGAGERVQIVHGREAALALPISFTPVDVAIVAIVDGSDRCS